MNMSKCHSLSWLKDIFRIIANSIIFKAACSVQIWKKKKTFCQNSNKFGYSFIKNDIMFMHLICIYKRNIILNLFKTDTLNFTMYIFTILTCPLKTYVIRLCNLISMNIFFTIKDPSFSSYRISSNKHPLALIKFWNG